MFVLTLWWFFRVNGPLQRPSLTIPDSRECLATSSLSEGPKGVVKGRFEDGLKRIEEDQSEAG